MSPGRWILYFTTRFISRLLRFHRSCLNKDLKIFKLRVRKKFFKKNEQKTFQSKKKSIYIGKLVKKIKKLNTYGYAYKKKHDEKGS